MKHILAVAVCVLLATPALALYVEVGDAPDFPAGGFQAAVGVGELDRISGATGAGDLVDAYKIMISDPAAFYATTSDVDDPDAVCVWDSRLFLATLAGEFVIANDDSPNPSAGLQSYLSDPSGFSGALENSPPSLTAGEYVLIITGYTNDPRDADDADLFDFATDYDALHGLDPVAGAFDHWETSGATGEYTIALDGASFVPEPASLALLAFGGLALIRRR